MFCERGGAAAIRLRPIRTLDRDLPWYNPVQMSLACGNGFLQQHLTGIPTATALRIKKADTHEDVPSLARGHHERPRHPDLAGARQNSATHTHQRAVWLPPR